MGWFSGTTYEEFFIKFFQLKFLKEAVGKEVILTERINLIRSDEYCDESNVLETRKISEIVISVSYGKDKSTPTDWVTVILSNGTLIRFFVPFLPVTPQIGYSNWSDSKILKKNKVGKKICHLRSFEMNGEIMHVSIM